jgi:hypothetical protein
LEEIVSVDPKHSIDYGQSLQFGEDQWKKLVAAKGDISVLGMQIKKSEPVPNFEFVKSSNRS